MRIKNSILLLIVALIVTTVLVLSVSAAEPFVCDGGTAADTEALIDLLGGTDGVFVRDGVITMRNDILLTGTIVIESGEYTIRGAGCRFDYTGDGNAFIIGKNAKVSFGDTEISSTSDGLVITGENSSSGSALIRIDEGGELTIYNGTYFENASHSAVENHGSFTMLGGGIRHCDSDKGGAICNYGSALLQGGSIFFTENGDETQKCTVGGAVFCEEGGTLGLAGTEILNCNAESGGAVYNKGDTIVAGSSIHLCKAVNGAGIYNDAAFTMSNGEIVFCEADELGGGIFSNSTLDLKGGTVNSCKAKSGGGLYCVGNLSISGTSVNSCEAEEYGGGIYITADCTAQFVSPSDASSNKAKFGGGIFNLGNLTLTGGGLYNNKADAGTALLNDGTLIFGKSSCIGKYNELFITISDDNSHAIQIGEKILINECARITVGTVKDGVYQIEFRPDVTLLTGDPELIKDAAPRLMIADDYKDQWTITADGKTAQKAGPVWIFIVIAAVLVLIIAVTAVLLLKKKKGQTHA